MIREPYIEINRKQLLDFKFLCETIRNNSIDKLAVTFAAIAELKENVDDPDVTYSLRESVDETLRKTKNMLCIPIPGHLNLKFCHLWDWVKEVKENLDDYIFVYNMFSDDWSKQTFHRILLCRFLSDVTYLKPTYKPIEYFDKDILGKREAAVLVDCGAFTGDSISSFIEVYGLDYHKIYAYEPEPNNFETLKKETTSLRDIVYRNCGVGETESMMRYHSGGPESHIVKDDILQVDTIIPIVSLDNDIKEPVSFIKMDIEGFEIEALRGAKCHIINDKPQMGISVYHLIEDLRVIPRLIYGYNKNQKFYIRNHRQEGICVAYELIFYAEPCFETF